MPKIKQTNTKPKTKIRKTLCEKRLEEYVKDKSVVEDIKLNNCGFSLNGQDFSNKTFINVEFTGADFRNVSFSSTLKEKIPSGFKNCVLKNIDFTDVQISDFNFDTCNVKNADFLRTKIKTLRFDTVTFSNVGFTDATITHVVFNKCIFDHVDFNGATITNVVFTECIFQPYRLRTVIHSFTTEPYPIKFKLSKITNVDLKGAVLTDVDLKGAVFTDVDLTGANLTGADLTGADLTGADLTGADLTGADLREAILTIDTLRATITETTKMDDAQRKLIEHIKKHEVGTQQMNKEFETFKDWKPDDDPESAFGKEYRKTAQSFYDKARNLGGKLKIKKRNYTAKKKTRTARTKKRKSK